MPVPSVIEGSELIASRMEFIAGIGVQKIKSVSLSKVVDSMRKITYNKGFVLLFIDGIIFGR